MPITPGSIKKIGQVAKAVVTGYADYAHKVKDINASVEKKFSKSFGNASTAADVGMVVKEIRKEKKEQGVSLRNSIRSKLNLY